MKKTFSVHIPDKTDERVVEAIKIEVRKYVKRERRKLLPEGADRWDFACKIGPDQATAVSTSVDEMYPAIDDVAKSDSAQVYVEVIASAHPIAAPAPVSEPPQNSAAT